MKKAFTYMLPILISMVLTSCSSDFTEGEKFMKQGSYKEAIDAFKLVPNEDKNYEKAKQLITISKNYITIFETEKLLSKTSTTQKYIDDLKNAKLRLSQMDVSIDSSLRIQVFKLNEKLDDTVKEKEELAELNRFENLWKENQGSAMRKVVKIMEEYSGKNWTSWTMWQQMSAPNKPFYDCSDLTFFIDNNYKFTLARVEGNWSAVGWASGTWKLSNDLFQKNRSDSENIYIKYKIKSFGNLWGMDQSDIRNSFRYCDEIELIQILERIYKVPNAKNVIATIIKDEKEKFLRKNGGWRKYKDKL